MPDLWWDAPDLGVKTCQILGQNMPDLWSEHARSLVGSHARSLVETRQIFGKNMPDLYENTPDLVKSSQRLST
jgi:hypothetical protein